MTEGGKELEIGSKAVREVEFRERIRGYHQDDVDEFLEKVALGIEVLEDRLREAERRAQLAEESASSQSDVLQSNEVTTRSALVGEDDIIQRTLILAQRTADQVLAEARENAERIEAAAQQEASSLLEDARRQVDVDLAMKVTDLQGQIESLLDEKTRIEGQLASVATEIVEARRSAAQLLRQSADELDAQSDQSVNLAAQSADEELSAADSSDMLWGGTQSQDSAVTVGAQENYSPPFGTLDAFGPQANGDFDPEVQDDLELPSYVSHESPSFDFSEGFQAVDEESPIPSFEIDANSLDEGGEDDKDLFLDFGRSKFQLLEDDSEYSNPKIFDDEPEK